MKRDGKDSSESVVRKKTVKSKVTDKEKVDIKFKKIIIIIRIKVYLSAKITKVKSR